MLGLGRYFIFLLPSIYGRPSTIRHPGTRTIGVTCSPKENHYESLWIIKESLWIHSISYNIPISYFHLNDHSNHLKWLNTRLRVMIACHNSNDSSNSIGSIEPHWNLVLIPKEGTTNHKVLYNRLKFVLNNELRIWLENIVTAINIKQRGKKEFSRP